MLRAGDLVKYHRPLESISTQGFKVGETYEVKQRANGGLELFVAVNQNIVPLQDDGALTDYADHFTLVRPEVRLPIGQRPVSRFGTIIY